jgi:two-component system, NtrC family, response regulator AtoC
VTNYQQTKIFIVEDDEVYTKLLAYKLRLNPSFDVQTYTSGKSVIASLDKNPSVITLDHFLPDMTGLDLLKIIKTRLPETQVILLSGQEDIAIAVDYMQSGAYDYITKDAASLDKLWHIVHQAKDKQVLQTEVTQLRQEISNKYNFQQSIIGASEKMQPVFETLKKTANSSITVSLTGETGTGKELVAKAIHFNSNRKSGPFIGINVAAIPKELIESELFGYEKGAFTGADKLRIGKFEEATNGTLFLDEIAEMDWYLQAKLLRALQEREITRIGSNKTIPFDVRIIIASHKDLLTEVKAGRFREDLFYRLLGITITLPPLRERGNDILLLTKNFLTQFCIDNNIHKASLSPGAIRKLINYDFPGNIRELKSVIEVAVVLAEDSIINEKDIHFVQTNEVKTTETNTLEAYTIAFIQKELNKFNGNVLKTSQHLAVGKSTIYRYIKEGKITINN